MSHATKPCPDPPDTEQPTAYLCLAGTTGERTAVAMHAIADAVTQCKFEATDPAADEVVLYKILQVAACRVCKASAARHISAMNGYA